MGETHSSVDTITKFLTVSHATLDSKLHNEDLFDLGMLLSQMYVSNQANSYPLKLCISEATNIKML